VRPRACKSHVGSAVDLLRRCQVVIAVHDELRCECCAPAARPKEGLTRTCGPGPCTIRTLSKRLVAPQTVRDQARVWDRRTKKLSCAAFALTRRHRFYAVRIGSNKM
jgi:hypothetical protein